MTKESPNVLEAQNHAWGWEARLSREALAAGTGCISWPSTPGLTATPEYTTTWASWAKQTARAWEAGKLDYRNRLQDGTGPDLGKSSLDGDCQLIGADVLDDQEAGA